jgi:hypothetical protein
MDFQKVFININIELGKLNLLVDSLKKREFTIKKGK